MLQTEVKLVTPEMARYWLENCMYEHQRPLNKRHVVFLSREMEKGEFDTSEPIQFSIFNGKEILTDGQHRLKAIEQSGMPQKLVIIKSEKETRKDLAKQYSYIDNGMSRKWSDVLRALNNGEVLLNAREANALKAGLGIVYRGFMNDGIKEPNVMMFERTLEWQSYAREYFDSIANVPPSINIPLRRRHMVALAMATIRFSKNKLGYGKNASMFWGQVAKDDGLRYKDPRKRLREILIESQLTTTNRKNKNISAQQCFLYSVRAWNAWVDNEEITRLVLPQSKLPIKCTPFDYSMATDAYRECFEKSYWGDIWK